MAAATAASTARRVSAADLPTDVRNQWYAAVLAEQVPKGSYMILCMMMYLYVSDCRFRK
jgi:hypothetical protein